ncbi:glycoside hydrolase family 97 protein [Aquimarina addita]|uniref:Glycoside hydrolase family 97 protein n=1 Tax=Aquimarina addita TaxID=870485 RepID=A0ABP6UPE4_9FLAO
MKELIIIVLILYTIVGCKRSEDTQIRLTSPDSKIELSFFLTSKKQAAYLIKYNNDVLIDSSLLGIDFKNKLPLKDNFIIKKIDTTSFNDTWKMVWGEDHEIINQYKELKVYLEETTHLHRKVTLVFKLYNDGVGFRYEFPDQNHLKKVTITDENTEFNLTGDHTVWWTPGDWDIYEYTYNTTVFSEINALEHYEPGTHLGQTYVPENAVNTPVTMKTQSGIYLSFHEADLTNYAGMTLKVDTLALQMKSELVGNKTGSKVIQQTPFHTPWRTIQIAEKPGNLVESKMILNLNEPNVIGALPYFEPTKYMGIWWDMHIGTGNWDYSGKNHAANTQYTKEMIDFASANNIGGILVEGWNIGWEQWWDKKQKSVDFDFVTPYPDYDLKKVVQYGKSKGVSLMMHHETSADVERYEKQLDTAFSLMNDLGIHMVKTGYVGTIIPEGEYHHGQWMVNHYQKVLEQGVKNKVVINAHEPIKATGKRRTYPVAISREGVRGQEYNAWSDDGGNPPEHLTIVPFTRMLGGPVDYTPGIFNTTLKPFKENNQINTTLAHQLALYVVLYSPVQMVPDLIPHYKDHPAFQFIRDVGVDWKQSKVLHAEIGDYITMAREEKNTGNWFIGSITDEHQRDLKLPLQFLDAHKKYKAKIYADTPDSHFSKNPEAYLIREQEVDATTILDLHLAPGGGCALTISLVTPTNF